jgi:hypothetical protein
VDLDGNGRPDVLSGSWPGEIYAFHRRPNGTYAAPVKLNHSSGRAIKVGSATALAAADWNGNGRIDLVIGNIEGAVFLVPNQGTAQKPAFGDAIRLNADGKPVIAEGGDAGPCVADWDGDGKPDLILGSGSGKVTWYRNVGTREEPKLAAPQPLIEKAGGPFTSMEDVDNPDRCGMRTKPAAADWNGDGKLDLLVGDFSYYSDGGASRRHGWVWVYLRR